MYELSDQDSGFLGISATEHQYINMLLKHAYQKGYMDAMDEFKSIINNQ